MRHGLPHGTRIPGFWPGLGGAAVQMAAWLALVGLGRQHLPLWAGGLLPLALWLAASACLQARPLSGLANRVAAQGPAATAVLAVSLWLLPAVGAAALLVAALAFAGVGHAVSRGAMAGVPKPRGAGLAGRHRWSPATPPALAPALGLALGSAAGLGPLLWGGLHAGWPAVVALAALVWHLQTWQRARPASVGVRRAALRARWSSNSAPNLAPNPVSRQAVAAPWRMRLARAASHAAMVAMMATLPSQLESCRSNGLPDGLALALHALVMALPLLLWRWINAWARLDAWCGLALFSGGVALWALPGWQGAMAASMLQSAAWALLMAHTVASGKPVWGCDPGAMGRLSAQAAVLVLALGWASAHWGAPAGLALQAALAAVGLVVLWPAQVHRLWIAATR